PRTESSWQNGDEPDARAARYRTRHHLFLQVQGKTRPSWPLEQSICAAEPGGAAQRRGRGNPARAEPAGEGSTPPRRSAALSRREGGLSPLRGRTEEVLEIAWG